jgi:hypothetical protein
MSQTVIGIFVSPKAAGEAIENLISQGFDKEDISVMQNGPTDESNSPIEREGSEDGITHFFKSLFNNDDSREEDYAEIAKNGTTVTIYTQSDDQSEIAANILDDFGAVHIEEKASEQRSNLAVEPDKDISILPDMDADSTAARKLPNYNEDIEMDSVEPNQDNRRENNLDNKSSENSMINMLGRNDEDEDKSQESESINARSHFRNQNITWDHDEDEASYNSNQSRNF